METKLSKVSQFIHKLFHVHNSDLFDDMRDIQVLFSALMSEYDVAYRQPLALSHENISRCDEKFKGNVEELFIDTINTKAHAASIVLFENACREFMDFSHSKLVDNRFRLVNLGSAFEYLKSKLNA